MSPGAHRRLLAQPDRTRAAGRLAVRRAPRENVATFREVSAERRALRPSAVPLTPRSADDLELPSGVLADGSVTAQRERAAEPLVGPAELLVRDLLAQGGGVLDAGLRRDAEAAAGQHLGDVRVFEGPAASRASVAVSAPAFSVGRSVVLGGEVDTASPAGHRIALHELAHAAHSPSSAGGPDRDTPLLLAARGSLEEREADATATGARRPGHGRGQGDRRGTAGEPAVLHRFESFEHVQLGDTSGAQTGRIILEAHRRDLPQHATPTAGWPPDWVARWARGTQQQKDAIQYGLTYGEVVALSGDMYASVQAAGGTDIAGTIQRIDHAPLTEIWDLIPLIRSPSATTGQFEEATGGRYMDLAQHNISHFSNVPVGQRNIDVWRDGHAQAVRLARAGQENAAWMAAAASDHFLTDAFSGGHLREARASLVGSKSGQLEAKVEHDLDNSHGVDVANAAGQTWTAYGDEHLNDAVDTLNRGIAMQAVARSKADITAALAQRMAYPDPPNPVPAGYFSAEQLVPHPVNVAAQRWNAADRAGEMAHLAGSEGPEQLTPNGDTRIRNWTARQSPAALRAVPVPDKIRMINRLLDGWVSDDDLDAVDRLCANSIESDMDQIELAITPRVGSLTSLGQRSRLRTILQRRS